MMKIKVLRANRGFWKDLFDLEFEDVSFLNNNTSITEDITNRSRNILWKLSQWKALDYLGIYQSIRANEKEADAFFSYNRFVHSLNPYLLAVENPTAMVHYHPLRAKSWLGKRNLKKSWNDPNLKAVICLSNACYNTMQFYYDIPDRINLFQIYPYIEDRITEEKLEEKKKSAVINCLFISSQFYLKGGGELIEAIKRNLWYENPKLHFDIITKKNQLDIETLTDLKRMKNVELWEFAFTKEELNKFYEKANIFINMTRMDSFSLVTLEALHFGCAFISTDMYAIKEMVHDGYNGYVTKAESHYWNEDDTMNCKLTKKEKAKLTEHINSERIVDFLSNKLNYLLEDRKKLEQMQNNSFIMSHKDFSKEVILEKWRKVFRVLRGDSY